MLISSFGSSPRLRGTRGSRGARRVDARFIPAPAGNTPGTRCRRRPIPVHPRACGEHDNWATTLAMADGSSPRLRGTRETASREAREIRFIPAPAGNTRSTRTDRPRGSVHPRACGEHNAVSYGTDLNDGSSPRLRGTLPRAERLGPVLRFIPAPAGNTLVRSARAVTLPVHPRACGEHTICPRWATGRAGSSPRLRGTRSPCWGRSNNQRFIPAPAGNTFSRTGTAVHETVHPRACGNTNSRPQLG